MDDATQSTSNSASDISRKKQSKNVIDSNNRNRRFLANLQATIGRGSEGNASPRTTKVRRDRNMDSSISESISSLGEALQRIVVSDHDICASLVDVKPFLQRNATGFTAEEFSDISAALCAAALSHTNIYFVVEICISLIEFVKFQSLMSICLKDLITKFLNDEGEEIDNLPDFLAQLLAAKWPRKFNRPAEESNQILFTGFNAIIGWTKFLLTKSNENAMDMETEFIFRRCAQGIISFSNSGQRFIWLNFPELYEEIFTVVVELLVGDAKLSRNIKSSLLRLHLSMSKWSLANLPKFSNATTQTLLKLDRK